MFLTARAAVPMVSLGLIAAVLVLPGVATAGKKSRSQDGRSFRHMTHDGGPRSRREPKFERWSVTVNLDAEEAIERRIDFRFVAGPDASVVPTELQLAVVDGARGDLCEELELGPGGDPSLLPVGLTQRPFEGRGFEHLGRPEVCAVSLTGQPTRHQRQRPSRRFQPSAARFLCSRVEQFPSCSGNW